MGNVKNSNLASDSQQPVKNKCCRLTASLEAVAEVITLGSLLVSFGANQV